MADELGTAIVIFVPWFARKSPSGTQYSSLASSVSYIFIILLSASCRWRMAVRMDELASDLEGVGKVWMDLENLLIRMVV